MRACKWHALVITLLIHSMLCNSAWAGDPYVRSIESVEVDPELNENGERTLTIFGVGLSGVNSVTIDGIEGKVEWRQSIALRLTIKLPPGDHSIKLHWGEDVSEPRTLCAPKDVHIEPCVLQPVYFDSKKDTLSPDAELTIKQNARCILASKQNNLTLLGSESDDGAEPGLSKRRAEAVQKFLIEVLGENKPPNLYLPIIALNSRYNAIPLPRRVQTEADKTRGKEEERPNSTNNEYDVKKESRRVLFANAGEDRLPCDGERIFVNGNVDKSAIIKMLTCFRQKHVSLGLITIDTTTDERSKYVKSDRSSFERREQILKELSFAYQELDLPMRLVGFAATNEQLKELKNKAKTLQAKDSKVDAWPAMPSTDAKTPIVAYLLPLQWDQSTTPNEAEPKGTNSTTTNENNVCESLALAPRPPPPPPCAVCENKLPPLPPQPAPKSPRLSASGRTGWLGLHDESYVGGGVRVARLFGALPWQLSVGLDVSAFSRSTVAAISSTEADPWLVLPAFTVGGVYRGSWSYASASLVGGPLLPTLNGFVGDLDLQVGLRAIDELALFGYFIPGIAVTDVTARRLQLGIGATIDWY